MIVGLRLRQRAALFIRLSAASVSGDEIGQDLQGLIVIGDRLVSLVASDERVAAEAQRDGGARIEGERLVEIAQRTFEIAAEPPELAAIGIGEVIFRFEQDSFVAIGDGEVELALIGEG